jgi:cytochrome c553
MRQPLFCALALLCTTHLVAQDGMKLYKQHCAACHGQKGERKAWSVTEPIASWSPDAVKSALLGYKERTRDIYGYGDYMHPQISNYTPEQIEKISRYVSTLNRATGTLASKRP